MSKDLFPGLPDDIFEEFNQDSKKDLSSISITLEKRKYGKIWAVIEGIKQENLKEVVSSIKTKLASAGTHKKNRIEILFGKTDKSKDLIMCLVDEGYQEESINISRKK